jgi:hypothetical protein
MRRNVIAIEAACTRGFMPPRASRRLTQIRRSGVRLWPGMCHNSFGDDHYWHWRALEHCLGGRAEQPTFESVVAVFTDDDEFRTDRRFEERICRQPLGEPVGDLDVEEKAPRSLYRPVEHELRGSAVTVVVAADDDTPLDDRP